MRAYGKLNLTLDVLGKRDDGYHDILSVMQTVSLFDEVTVEKSDSWQLITNCPELPIDDGNLAVKAAKAFFKAIDINGHALKITIEKNIPVFAGLGGGSADAAAVLRELNSVYGKPLTHDQLLETALTVGSDVPFLVQGGTALVSGRGEKILPLTPIDDCFFVVCKPPFDLSAGQMYGLIDSWNAITKPATAEVVEAIVRRKTKKALSMLENVFFPLAASRYPELAKINDVMKAGGAYAVSMTGKGPSMFGVYFDENEAIAVKNKLFARYPNTFVAKNV